MAISAKPKASRPRRGLISAQMSGRFFHAFLSFSRFGSDLTAFSVAMICGKNCALAVRCRQQRLDYIANPDRTAKTSSIAGGSGSGYTRPRRAIEIQHAGNELAERDAEVAPQSPLEAGIVLRAAEEVAHQLPEDGAAAQELNHAGRDRAPQEGAAIEPPHDSRREFQFGGEGGPHPSGILFRAAFRDRTPEQ